MARRSSMLAAAILVLLNFVLASAALRVIDTSKLGKGIVVLTENDFVTEEHKAKHLAEDKNSKFVGDLEVGIRRGDEFLWGHYLSIINRLDQFFSVPFEITVHDRKIHYFGLTNDAGSEVVACASPYVLGGSTAKFEVRVKPNSASYFTVTIGSL